jgi:glycosyltransferase involved in cell wall biosynthesis
VIAGRIGDDEYARDILFPSVGGDVEYAGELAPAPLAALVGRSGLALATPAWAEPFGLVGPEALMCGTPVVGFAVGGVPEIAAATMGMQLVAAGDVAAMTERAASMLPSGKDAAFRAVVRETAVRRFSLDTRIDALEASFARLRETESAA